MKKKRLTKSEKVTLEKINGIQLRTLTLLKERANVLLKATQDVLDKVEQNGISNHYSKNSDVLRYAQELWSASYRLGELKSLHDDLIYSYGKK